MGPVAVLGNAGEDPVMFLTVDQLKELTGYQKPALQRKWLLDNGYRFDVRNDGTPAFLVAQVQLRQLKALYGKAKVEETPDFAALDD